MTMDDRDGFIWYDGKLVDWRKANTHVLTHTLHYGMGVFEGIRAYETPKGPAIFRLQEHVDRFFDSAKIFMMDMPWDKAAITEGCIASIRENRLSSGYIRPIAFYGSEAMGVATRNCSVRVAIAAWPWGAYLGAEGMEKGINVKTSSYTRHHVNSTLCRAKAVSTYTNSILANREATSQGYDEALLLDIHGLVAEGSGENIFFIKKGKLYTPQLTSCLDGITRDAIFTIAKDMGIEVIEKPITRDEIYCADEAFFTGTAAEVTPIRSLDDRIIGEGCRGPITKKLQDKFFAIVSGQDEQYGHWLTYVK